MSSGKSVVSRWISGANTPSAHNLSGLTAVVAARHPGFTMFDWDADIDTLAAKLGVAPGADTATSGSAWEGLLEWIPEWVLRDILAATSIRGSAYEGFWRTTRPSNEFPGRFAHDRMIVRKDRHGLLRFKMGVVDMRFEGYIFPLQTQLYSIAVDAVTGVFLFTIANAVLRQRADVLDGLSLTLTRGGCGTLVAGAILLERTGLLTGDADDAAYEDSIGRDPMAPEGSIADHVKAHLLRDVGPSALAAGGQAMLTLGFAQSMSRGPDARFPFPE